MNARMNLRMDVVRPIALAWVFTTSGALIAFILKLTSGFQLPKLASSAITFGAASAAVFLLFPRMLKQPLGTIELRPYLRQLGFYLPRDSWKHILLGILLAALTLFGMLIGSLLTGRHAFGPDTVNLIQILFSLNPGIWEKFFFRGVIMFACIRLTSSVKRAALLQISSSASHTSKPWIFGRGSMSYQSW
jgi:hypothetical protein